jgi:hypothetical protein
VESMRVAEYEQICLGTPLEKVAPWPWLAEKARVSVPPMTPRQARKHTTDAVALSSPPFSSCAVNTL